MHCSSCIPVTSSFAVPSYLPVAVLYFNTASSDIFVSIFSFFASSALDTVVITPDGKQLIIRIAVSRAAVILLFINYIIYFMSYLHAINIKYTFPLSCILSLYCLKQSVHGGSLTLLMAVLLPVFCNKKGNLCRHISGKDFLKIYYSIGSCHIKIHVTDSVTKKDRSSVARTASAS